MLVLRTPEERFADLPDFPFEPHYADITAIPGDSSAGTLRVHYLDEGPRDAAPVLLMHGEPSWCFLYRHMIPALVAAGHRVIAPDLVGFGRSDKPSEMTDYSYARHVAWMSELMFDRLDLQHATFFGQDWGGLVGLRLVAAAPERFDRVVIGNTGLPTGRNPAHSRRRKSTWPDDTDKAGARIFPSFVPTTLADPERDANLAAWAVLEQFDKPFLCAFSDSDPVTKGGERAFIDRVPGTAGQPHTTVVGGGHFLQEDKGAELASIIIEFIDRTR